MMSQTNEFVETPESRPPLGRSSGGVSDRSGPPGQPGRRVGPSQTGVTRAAHHKSVFLACCLSLLPGVGQVYVGYYKLGFVHNVVFAGTLMVLVTGPPEALTTFVGVFLAFFFVYNIVDAGRRAAYFNMAVDGVEGIELPDDMNVALPSFRGSIAGGVALMASGLVLLSNTLFGMSLQWVEAFWPVAPIALGAYLVWKAREERHQASKTPRLSPANPNQTDDDV